ncbi:MAG: hypothetical protein KAR64_09260 [Thermoplasmatales archaeon]|nr:hypothetical protein [Thermoplasmatales archaeon]
MNEWHSKEITDASYKELISLTKWISKLESPKKEYSNLYSSECCIV